MARYRLRLPPLAEQRRIVAKVEDVLGWVNAARQRLAKVSALLKRFRQSVLAAALQGDECRLADILIDLKYGTSKKCEPERSGVPVLRIPNVAKGAIDQSNLKYAELDDKERRATALNPGDLLMIRSNGSVSLLGRTALVSEKEHGFAYAGYLMRLRLKQTKAVPKYIHLALSGHDCRDQIEMPARSTSGVNNINSDEVRNLCLPLPPLAEQHEIVRGVEALFALADKIEARVASASVRADKLIQSTLAKAFRGELIPTEHALAEAEGRTYETAEQLLARVQNAPAAAAKRNSPIRKNKPTTPVAAKPNAKIEIALAKKHSKGIFFKRAAIASYAVHRLHSKDTFGRIQLEKLLYLCEEHVGIDLEGEYKRQAAGPLDTDIYKIESLARKYKWFDSCKRSGFGVKYLPGAQIADRTGAARTLLGAKSPEMDRLLGWFEKMTTEQAEVFATVFPAWNDLLIDGAGANEDQIIEQVRQHWHASKERFTPQRLRDCIGWMRSNHLSPHGVGPRTILSERTPAPDNPRQTRPPS